MDTVVQIKYVVGFYDPETCTYSYMSTFGHINKLERATLFNTSKLGLDGLKEKRNNIFDDRFYNKKGIKVMASKVMVRVFNNENYPCALSVRLTKYNHYQKLASLMT